MALPSRPSLSNALVVLCEDVFFAITAAHVLSIDTLRALARRRAPVVASLLPDIVTKISFRTAFFFLLFPS